MEENEEDIDATPHSTVISGDITIRSGGQNHDTVYLYLPGNPSRPGAPVYKSVFKTISLSSIINKYKGPSVSLDFDATGLLIGIEVLA